ncbi:hypothetical protein C3B47_13460 [Flavobacterium columnare]|uniref:SMODS-associated NUDIX domain-containing protein n=1 Tax=Flavobacterium columnare TaxID=996 RepID=UPI0018968907|nr:hypothetical protein [Flavobacterium columnare]MBF6653870.1 hypothetical protein [Flavobacterium columnare]MBF6656956.1 hypothetical protein [Flavobacterium columnare]
MAELLTTLLKPILSKGGSIIWENRKHLTTYFKTKIGSYKNKDIRFSISYLFKIQIPNSNKYLLVKNRRIDNQIQPVGGAYKRYGDDSLFNKWEYKPDNKNNGLNVDEKSTADLRFMVKGKYSIEVMNWFESMQEREINPNREFKEELLDTNILDTNIFQNINYKHIRRFSKNLIWSDFFSCYEILVFDVFELIPNEEQKQFLIELGKAGTNLNKDYAIVECDDIEQLRLMEKEKQVARIGQHTKLLINKTF